MTETPEETGDSLTPDELDEQDGEALPEREAMSVITPAGGPDFEIGLPPPRD